MCEHYRAPKYHGPYVRGRCPDCGRYVVGVSTRFTHRVYVVDDRNVNRAIAVVTVRIPETGEVVQGLLYYDGFWEAERVQAGLAVYRPEHVEILDSRPWQGDPENPWIKILPV